MKFRYIANFIILITISVGYLSVISYIYHFSQTRFFTVDEYQFGCATAMVAKGNLPYIDFFEHHTPLSYALHSFFFFDNDGDFSERALRFRKISFFYILLSSILLGIYFWLKTKYILYVGLGAIVPLTIGFGLLSSIDYRADSFGAFFLLASLLINDINKKSYQRKWAFLSGAFLAIAFLMTQKYLYFGYLSFGLFLLHDFLICLFDKSTKKYLITHHRYWLAGNLGILIIFITASIYLNFFDEMIELAFQGAILHEKVYGAVHFSQYLENYLDKTKFSTIFLLLLTVFYLLRTENKYWCIVVFISLISCFLIKAQYPYNFIYPCLILGFCAVAGVHLLVEIHLAGKTYLRLFCLIAFTFVVFNQISFTFHKTTNHHQLTLLDKLQRMSNKDDRVIDNAGGYLFLTPATYYFMHGGGHRAILQNIFKERLIKDYIESGARFLIMDFRYPSYVKDYLKNNYITLDGSLKVYGRIVKPNNHNQEISFKVIKDGTYYFFTESEKNNLKFDHSPLPIVINGITNFNKSIQLKKGTYILTLPALEENFYISSVPIDNFRNEIGSQDHTMLFQY